MARLDSFRAWVWLGCLGLLAAQAQAGPLALANRGGYDLILYGRGRPDLVVEAARGPEWHRLEVERDPARDSWRVDLGGAREVRILTRRNDLDFGVTQGLRPCLDGWESLQVHYRGLRGTPRLESWELYRGGALDLPVRSPVAFPSPGVLRLGYDPLAR